MPLLRSASDLHLLKAWSSLAHAHAKLLNIRRALARPDFRLARRHGSGRGFSGTRPPLRRLYGEEIRERPFGRKLGVEKRHQS